MYLVHLVGDFLNWILNDPYRIVASVAATLVGLLIWNFFGKIKMCVKKPKLSFIESGIYDVGSTTSLNKVASFRILAAKCTVVNRSRFGRQFCDTAANASIKMQSPMLDGLLFWKPTRLVDDYTLATNTRTWVDELYAKHFIQGAGKYETATLKVNERKEIIVAIQLKSQKDPGDCPFLFGNEKKELNPAVKYDLEISLEYNRRTGEGDYSTGFKKFALDFSNNRFAQVDC